MVNLINCYQPATAQRNCNDRGIGMVSKVLIHVMDKLKNFEESNCNDPCHNVTILKLHQILYLRTLELSKIVLLIQEILLNLS